MSQNERMEINKQIKDFKNKISYYSRIESKISYSIINEYKKQIKRLYAYMKMEENIKEVEFEESFYIQQNTYCS
jgi:hypothetical protein